METKKEKSILRRLLDKVKGLKEHREVKYRKLREMKEDGTYSDEQIQEVNDRADSINSEIESVNIDIKKSRAKITSQIENIKQSITKFLDTETGTLGERIRTLFREQGITITSILTAIGMAIGVIVEALIPGGGSANTNSSNNGEGRGKDKKGGAKEWIQNKLKALAGLLSKLANKALAALPGIIGSIIS